MMIRIGFLILTIAALGGVEAVAEADRRGVIRLDETVISGNQELPKVLYIVPWKDPDGMPGIELEPEFTELQVFRRLYPPAYRRELNYYELLNAVETEE
jgi:hypothetical protein